MKIIVRSTKNADNWQVVLFKDDGEYKTALVDIHQQKHGVDTYITAEMALAEYVKRCEWNGVEA